MNELRNCLVRLYSFCLVKEDPQTENKNLCKIKLYRQMTAKCSLIALQNAPTGVSYKTIMVHFVGNNVTSYAALLARDVDVVIVYMYSFMSK